MSENLKEKIESLPDEPGVYMMKDHAGGIVYVGKAKNLRKRVRAYFEGRDERMLIPFLEQAVSDVETIIVENEKEALLLENELIKIHKPRFNIKLKEGGNFVYLRLHPGEAYPRLEVTRQVRKDGARYFGPYPAARALRETLRIMNRHFRLRTCTDHDPSQHERPCLLCQISDFPEPSVYDIPPEEYRRHVLDAIRFLEGKKPELLESLQNQMEEAASSLRFEEAARIRDRISAVERTLEPQKIKTDGQTDQDAIGVHRENHQFAAYVLFIRKGRVIGGRSFLFGSQTFPERELLASFLNLYYTEEELIPDEILLPFEVEGMSGLEELLSERKGDRVRLAVPKAGTAEALIRMSARNARQAAGKPRTDEDEWTRLLERLQHDLNLSRVPRRIECFDVSHFHGEMIVASKVAMTDGRLDKDRYRRYRIRSVNVGDDYTAMFEVVTRRLRHGLKENDLPDLIVLDGGKPQLSAGVAAMQALGVKGVDIAALAKKRETGSKEEVPVKTPERFFIPGEKEPIILPQTSPELLLLVRLRDEAHRFAITYQKKLSRRERLRSELDAIPGIGEKRKRALLSRFGSIEGIAKADMKDLSETEGLGPSVARRIYVYFHPDRSPSGAEDDGS
jgi:excinuclease ABC subunit C